MSQWVKIMPLKTFRKQQGWNQHELAERLGVSQTLVSLWESGVRDVPANRLQQLWKLGMKADATELPLRTDVNAMKVDYAQELANLGYPGFEHFRTGNAAFNPAQLLVMTLSENHLNRRVAEAVPWLVLQYSEMDWSWVRDQAKLRDLQNRLGFTLALGRKLAEEKRKFKLANDLREQEAVLRTSLLAREDTYCNERMTSAERDWLRTTRSSDAAAWNVLSDLATNHLTHV